MPKYLYRQLTWPEARERAQQGAVIVIPVAAIEQHGYHLPIDEKGAHMAEIHSERSETLQAFEAPFAGKILGLRSKAHIQQGAWAVLLGSRRNLA